MDAASPVPIAIVGLSCRFPGDASTLDRLWKLCANAHNTWSKWPKDRLNEAAFFHPRPEHLGTFHNQGGHFLTQDISRHDAAFFNYTPDLAKAVDPQIRILLETVFESFESAGITLDDVAGSQCSVFAGSMFRDYHDILMKDTENLDRYFLTGNTPTMTANRISHFFDLRGGSVTVDTACSTALTALHLACQGLRSGETDMAIVGGSNLLLYPGSSLGLSNLGLTGHDGKCYSFDSRAEGYGRGEGVASLVIKRLPDAIRDGDPIRAVIRETGMNQDGQTPTITSPAREAQEALIRTCYQRAGLNPKDTAYVEAHGTGTIAGDTIETKALGSVFGEGRSEQDPLLLGSIKANLGHTESTSGLAAVLKVVLMLEREKIPPQALLETPNPNIDFAALKLQVPKALMDWPTDKPMRASISNFGAGGTNTHVIIEHAKYHASSNSTTCPRETEQNGYLHGGKTSNCVNGCQRKSSNASFVFSLGAKEEKSLNASLTALGEYLQSIDTRWTIQDLAYTLGQRRSKFPWRVAVTASSIPELKVTLNSYRPTPVKVSGEPRLGFAFTGQGAAWHAMGRELIFAYPVFAEAIDEADNCLRLLGASWSARDELLKSKDSTRVGNAQFSFPLSVIIQLALVRILASWGIIPTATTGHSSGEIAAAYAASIIDFEEAIAISFIRGQLTSASVESGRLSGGMTALALGKEQALEYIQNVKSGRAVIACINSPSSVTLSGDVSALDEIEQQAKSQQIFARRLKVPAAYHSPEMKALANDYLSQLEPHLKEREITRSRTSFFSSVTGRQVNDTNSVRRANYWVDNMVQAVQFEDSLSELIKGDELQRSTGHAPSIDVIVEVGPHGTLQSPIRQTIRAPAFENLTIDVWSCLSRDKDSVKTMQELAGALHCRGLPVDLKAVNFPFGDSGVQVVHDLPRYQWNHSTRYWAEPSLTRDMLQRDYARHDLLGSRVEESHPELIMWRNTIRLSDLPWLQEHLLQSEPLYPGAGLLAMAIEAIQQLDSSPNDNKHYAFTEIELLNGLVIPDEQHDIETQFVLTNSSHQLLSPDQARNFSIFSRSRSGGWVEHCRGKASTVRNLSFATHAISGNDLTPVNIKYFYKYLEKYGPTLGRPFQNITALEGGDTEARATVTVPEIGPMMPTPYFSQCWVHPTTLDACFQAAWAAVPKSHMRRLGLCVPRGAARVYVDPSSKLEPGAQLGVHVSLDDISPEGFVVSARVFRLDDPEQRLILKLERLRILSLSRGQVEDTDESLFLEPVWRPDISFLSNLDFQSWVPSETDEGECKILEDLQVAAIHIIHDTLQQLTLEDEKLLNGHFRKLVAWMRGSLKDHLPSYRVYDETAKQSLYEQVASSSINGKILGLLRENLYKFLRKEANPLDVLLSDGLLQDYYANAIKVNRCLGYVEKYVGLFAHKFPRAQILEIGAAAGACTDVVIRALTRGPNEPLTVNRYDITDSSLDFVNSLGERYREFSDQVACQTLDIEEEPASQGFEAGQYDLVIAYNVLHASQSLDRTITNVRRLLRPGGKLLILENTRPHLDHSLTFGLFEGWWSSKDDREGGGPLLDSQQWQAILTKAGFSNFDAVLGDSCSATESNYSTMVATATDNQPSFETSSAISVVDLGNDLELSQQGYQNLAQSLQGVTGRTVNVGQIADVSLEDKSAVVLLATAEGTLSDMTSERFERLKAIVQKADGILWISRGATVESTHPDQALHLGLLRTLRLEHVGERFISVDLDSAEPWWSEASVKAISGVFQFALGPIQQDTVDYEFSLRSGNILVCRMFRSLGLDKTFAGNDSKAQQQAFSFSGPYASLEVGTHGLLDSLVFKESIEPDFGKQPGDNVVEIQPHAFGLNFRDVYVAMGQMDQKWVGLECAGYVSKVGPGVPDSLTVGDRVSALMSAGRFANRVLVPATSVVGIPEDMSFEMAASIPVIYITAYQALISMANIQPGETVLIHSAAGGLGQASIAVARYRGAEIFATVGSESKRAFLSERYGIPGHRIFSSRDPSFAAEVMAATGGKGVDVIINSLAGPLLQAGWDCISDFGRFIELGKRDATLNKYLEMKHFNRSVTYAALDTLSLSLLRPKTLSCVFHNLMDLFRTKKIRHQIPITTYGISEIHQAFRKLQGGTSIGKIVVRAEEGQQILVVPRTKTLNLDPDSTYLVVGGLKGIGREISRWLARNGAKHLTVISRSAESVPGAATLEADLRAAGTELLVHNCDITDRMHLETVLDRCRNISGRRIRGVVQAAADLQDSVFDNMTHDQWTRGTRPKVYGTRNLAEIFQQSPLGGGGGAADALDFFVILSSATGIFGSIGQSNYTASATYQDALALNRTSRGLPTVSIDLSSVLSVGIAARTEGVYDRLARAGYEPLEVLDVLRVIEMGILYPERAQGQLVVGIDPFRATDNVPYRDEARFAGLKPPGSSESRSSSAGTTTNTPSTTLKGRLAKARSSADMPTEMVVEALQDRVGKMLGMAASDVDPDKTLLHYGVDSLVAVELRNWLTANATANITIFDITQSGSIRGLADRVGEKVLSAADKG